MKKSVLDNNEYQRVLIYPPPVDETDGMTFSNDDIWIQQPRPRKDSPFTFFNPESRLTLSISADHIRTFMKSGSTITDICVPTGTLVLRYRVKYRSTGFVWDYSEVLK